MPTHSVSAAQRWREAWVRPYFMMEKPFEEPEVEEPDPVEITLRKLVPGLYFKPQIVALCARDADLDLSGAQSLLLAEIMLNVYMLVVDSALGSAGVYEIPDDLACSPGRRASVIKRLDELLDPSRPFDGRKLN